MMDPHIKILDVTLPSNRDACDKVLQEKVWPSVKPEWHLQNVVSEPIESGAINQLAVYHIHDDVIKRDAVVVRVSRHGVTDGRSRDMEFIKMQVAEQLGGFPTILAVLRNGFIYEYAQGQPLQLDDLRSHTIVEKAAGLLARFHWTDPASFKGLINRAGEQTDFSSNDSFLENTRSFCDAIPSTPPSTPEEARMKRECLAATLKNELGFLERFLQGLELPVANTHNDFFEENILYDEVSGRLTLLDYEWSFYGNFAMFDLGYYFASVHREYVDSANCSVMSMAEVKEMWIRAYLREMRQLQGGNPASISSTEVALWMTYLEIMEPLAAFHQATRLMYLIDMDIKFSAIRHAKINLNFYLERKSDLPALKQKCLELRTQLSSTH